MNHPNQMRPILNLITDMQEIGKVLNDNRDMTSVMLRYLKKKYDLQTINLYLVAKYRELQYMLNVPYNKELLARKMFNKDKFIADYLGNI